MVTKMAADIAQGFGKDERQCRPHYCARLGCGKQLVCLALQTQEYEG